MLEHSLGHITHAQNLKQALESRSDIQPYYIDLPFHNIPGIWSRLPGIRSNWTVRASIGAYLALRTQAKILQAALFHTQVTSLFSPGLMRRLPSVISLDATPVQYDALGQHYGHSPSSNARIEALKRRLNIRALMAAQQLVTWSQWTKRSLVTDYAVPPEKITVIPPGIDTDRWCFSRPSVARHEPLHLLFVGGDFERKGGHLLLDAFQSLTYRMKAQLHIVTTTADVGKGIPNVHVYRDVTPNSDKLLRLFQQADIFVFPTLADCLPLAVMEASAAGLPIITTDVGALPEAVIHAETGWVIPPGDVSALTDAMILVGTDPGLRAKLGCRAHEVARERFDATTNYRHLLNVVVGVAH